MHTVDDDQCLQESSYRLNSLRYNSKTKFKYHLTKYQISSWIGMLVFANNCLLFGVICLSFPAILTMVIHLIRLSKELKVINHCHRKVNGIAQRSYLLLYP